MRAVFRCDASVEIGGGHVSRCMALAAELQRVGWEVDFVFRRGTPETVPRLVQSGFVLYELASSVDEDDQALVKRFSGGVDLLVVDHYGLSARFESASREWADRILVIDDLANRIHDCDMLLDQNIHRTEEDYRSLVPEGCRLLLGPSFALLRPEFGETRSFSLRRRASAQRVERIIVSFGAADAFHMSSLALEAIELLAGEFRVDVVCGKASQDPARMRAVANRLGRRVTILTDVGDMASLMARADLALGAPGTTAWERCCLGLPSVLAVLAENQARNARELQRCGAAISLGWYSKLEARGIADVLLGILNNGEQLRSMSRASAHLCDGRGVLRLRMELEPPERTSRGGHVRLRLAEPGNMDLLYVWQSDQRTRQFAKNPAVPSYSEHKDWFAAKMSDPDAFLTVILHNDEPSGVLRLDQIAGPRTFLVSILVSPEKYREGIGAAALRLARRLWYECEFHAEVLENNTASHRLFQSVGYFRQAENLYVSPPLRSAP